MDKIGKARSLYIPIEPVAKPPRNRAADKEYRAYVIDRITRTKRGWQP